MNKRMNFFKPFIKEKPKTNYKRLLYVVLGIVAVFVVVYFAADLYFTEKGLKEECANLDAQITDPQYVEAIERVNQKVETVGKLNGYLEDLLAVELFYRSSNVGSDILISMINAQVPDKLFLTDINISGTSITFTGSAIDQDNISQFVYNLRKEEFIENVFIDSISNNNSNYDFSITATLVGVPTESSEEEIPASSDENENVQLPHGEMHAAVSKEANHGNE